MPQWLGRLWSLTFVVAVVSFLVLGAAAAGLSHFIMRHQTGTIAQVAEDAALSLNRLFSNMVWPRYAAFVADAHRLEPAAIVDHPLTRDLLRDAGNLTSGTRILKFKLYDLRGLTVFSSRLEEIGSNRYSSPGLQAALAGRITSMLEHRARFAAADGDRSNVYVVQSYLPIRSGEPGLVAAVLEVYTDATGTYRAALAGIRNAVMVVIATFGIAFILIVVITSYAEREIERRRRENAALADAVRQAEIVNRAKSQFLANMSHELRTPLNAIIGFTEMMEHQYLGPLGDRRYLTYLSHVLQASRHLLQIVDDVLDLSRIEAGKMQLDRIPVLPADMARSVLLLIESSAAQAGLELECLVADNLPAITVDPGKLRQVLLNLLSNAVRFTPAGGRVTLSASATEDAVIFHVKDTGIGIRREDVPHALTPFGQIHHPFIRKAGGTGLGLPLSSQLAGLMGGRLEIESEPGAGTSVRVILPLSPAQEGATPSPIAANRR